MTEWQSAIAPSDEKCTFGRWLNSFQWIYFLCFWGSLINGSFVIDDCSSTQKIYTFKKYQEILQFVCNNRPLEPEKNASDHCAASTAHKLGDKIPSRSYRSRAQFIFSPSLCFFFFPGSLSCPFINPSRFFGGEQYGQLWREIIGAFLSVRRPMKFKGGFKNADRNKSRLHRVRFKLV